MAISSINSISSSMQVAQNTRRMEGNTSVAEITTAREQTMASDKSGLNAMTSRIQSVNSALDQNYNGEAQKYQANSNADYSKPSPNAAGIDVVV
ncbi:hypothetical protein [Magnetofaba australis]|uniref:Uncharacterized protein n=1 Tax=Magnetofaba australis IT-1 TaxID=1434232 RepID=A0A1Y2K6Z3_9PROT|nr:hypothetical protein [Magnetofaba australis]OSM05077.1 hypothetical protein MAIT1_03215 [Magnetofaba australis IT-1]